MKKISLIVTMVVLCLLASITASALPDWRNWKDPRPKGANDSPNITSQFIIRSMVPNLPKTVVLFFDDGYYNQYANAFPMLQNYGFKATFGIITECVGQGTGNMIWGIMNSQQLINLNKAGMEIASHSVDHPYLTTLTDSQAMEELLDSKSTLEGIIGSPVVSFIIPYSDATSHTLDLITSVYPYYRAVFYAPDFYWIDEYQSLNTFISYIQGKDIIFLGYHHIVSGLSEYGIDPKVFQQQMQYLYNNHYQVITLRQFMDYVNLYNRYW